MEATRSSGGGSGESTAYTPEIAETLRFEEEIQSLIHPGVDPSPPTGGGSGGGGGSSFTALLGLAPNQAVELLHDPEPGQSSAVPRGGDPCRFRPPLGCSPTFPSNAALVERAARFSVFATAEDSPQSSSAPPPPKSEPADSGSPPLGPAPPQRPGKRKEAEKNKAKGSAKKSRSVEEAAGKAAEESTDCEKLPYVHVRARRGQATDSHSLAERARREKINARMKLLQELVPGCSKISGTALVLDEIINHVQSLQRQVQFLSMSLAAVNPRIDFGSLDAFLSAEWGRVGGGMMGAELQPWTEAAMGNGGGGGGRRQQIWHAELVQPPQHQEQQALWERDDTQHHQHHQGHVFINPGASLFPHDSPSPVSLHSNQLKTEL